MLLCACNLFGPNPHMTGYGDIIPQNVQQVLFTTVFGIFGCTLGAVIVGIITTYFNR
jgi:hypothetical protein